MTIHKLVITEKPSVAQSIARIIGVAKHQNGYLEGNGYLVSWCIGHLIELSDPECYDKRFARWRLEDLPIIPEHFLYEVSAGTGKQYQILKGLMERLWISSMEDTAIREGFEKLKPGNAYDALYKAALCRERADWIVGINATRLFSCLYDQTLVVGRVMTPTLAMVVMRDAKIQGFKSESFFEVELRCGGLSAISIRVSEKSEAESAVLDCRNAGKAKVSSLIRKEKVERPPALYDLTALQRDANRILGFTAKQTLDYTQKLYEKKLVTYPRTDSRYLTDDMVSTLPERLTKTARAFGLPEFFMDPQNDNHNKQIGQVINSKKVSDHHAIIPTKTCADKDLFGLPSGEMQILMLIACRFLCAVSEPHRYAETSITLSCAGREYTAKEKEVLHEGWKRIEQHFYPAVKKEKEEKEALNLSEIREGMVLPVSNAGVREGKTSPPKHFTEVICSLRGEWTAPIKERSLA